MKKVFTIDLMWDDDAAVWVATSDDVPGLVMESGSLDALTERLRSAVPELLSLNSVDAKESTIHLRAERRELEMAPLNSPNGQA